MAGMVVPGRSDSGSTIHWTSRSGVFGIRPRMVVRLPQSVSDGATRPVAPGTPGMEWHAPQPYAPSIWRPRSGLPPGTCAGEDPVAVAADLGAGEADQLPADHPAVAAVDRVAEEAGDRVRAQDLEEGLQAEDLAGRRGVLDRLRPGARELDRHVLDPDDAHHLVGLPAVHRA